MSYEVDQINFREFFAEEDFQLVLIMKWDTLSMKAMKVLSGQRIIPCLSISDYDEADGYEYQTTLFLCSDLKMIGDLREKVGRFRATTLEHIWKRMQMCQGCLINKEHLVLSEYKNIAEGLQRQGVIVKAFIFPKLGEIEKLTDEEKELWERKCETVKMEDIDNNPDLYLRLFQKYSSTETIKKVIERVPIIEKNGLKIHSDYSSEFCNICNGRRVTLDTPEYYGQTIYIFGKSGVYGYGVEDGDTIASFLQGILNRNNQNVRVVNMGVSAIDDKDINHLIESVEYKKGDIVLYIYMKRRCAKSYCCFSEAVSLKEVFEKRETALSSFLDSIPHTNWVGNSQVAEFIYDILIKEEALCADYCKPPEPLKRVKQKEKASISEELKEYLEKIQNYSKENKEELKIGAIVMNCNPFTLGHRYLIETAASQVDCLYVFVVEEDKSVFPFSDRIQLVKEGTKDLGNVIVLPSGQFMISSLTFPEYFEKEKEKNVRIDSAMDLDIFGQHIAPVMGISIRFAGEEPKDMVTRQYNEGMREYLPQYGIQFVEIPRKKSGDTIISATTVRDCVRRGDYNELKKLVPECTLIYLMNKKTTGN